MNRSRFLVLCSLLLTWALNGPALGQEARVPQVRIAELEIDPAQLEAYKAALREEVETSIRAEPGVLALYSVYEKDNPTRVRLLEIYATATRTTRTSPRLTSRNTRRAR